ncbi:MAG TPA: nuclear transport factor 2 family protein [Opitutaceae bacterium]
MKRRQFILSGTGALAGALLASTAARAADASEEETIKQFVRDDYFTFYVLQDREKYRAMLADDYLLLEQGEILDIEGDLGLMPPPDVEYKRTDTFEFHSVKINGDTAWAVYTLRSDITDKERGPRHREFLESMVLRRSGTGWLAALLHSTRLPDPAK